MSLYTAKELEEMGLIKNPNMYIGDGWMYCKVCEKYTHHYAMSHVGKHDCYEVCKECNCFSR